MLYWAVIFLLIAIVSAIFGFSGLAAGSAGIAKIMCLVFLFLFLATLIAKLVHRFS